jgi:hypothetical protein
MRGRVVQRVLAGMQGCTVGFHLGEWLFSRENVAMVDAIAKRRTAAVCSK